MFDLNKIIHSDYFLIGGILFLSSFILSPIGLTDIKIIKVLQKALIGMGAILLFFWISGLPNLESARIIGFVFLYSLMILLNLYHAYGFLSTCNSCETPFEWGNCPGFKTVRDNFEKYELFNLLVHLKEFSLKKKQK